MTRRDPEIKSGQRDPTQQVKARYRHRQSPLYPLAHALIVIIDRRIADQAGVGIGKDRGNDP